MVPTIWFLELDEMEKRIKDKANKVNATTPLTTTTHFYDDYMAFTDSDDDKLFAVCILSLLFICGLA